MSQATLDEPRTDTGVEANARLTGSTGAVLLVLLFLEGLTLLAMHSLLRWHELIGVLLIPPVLLKLGSTGYRFFRYYSGEPRYRRKGPPAWILRLTAPVMVALTVALFASGIWLAVAGARSQWVFFVHKATFILWFGAMTVHVLGHLLETVSVGTDDWSSRALRIPGRAVRRGLVVGSVVVGVVAAVLVAPSFPHFLSLG